MRQRRVCRAILAKGLDDFPGQRGVLQALLLGYREDLPSALQEDFSSTGTVHLFAISGAHVGMVLLLLLGFLRTVGIPMTRWLWIAAPVLLLYTLLTGAAVSAVRACLMACVLVAAPALHRRPDALSSLALAAIFILVASPLQVGELGFVLSFTTVGGLIVLQPLMDEPLRRLFRGDSWQLPEAENSLQTQWRKIGRAIARSGSVSIAAWLSTSPFTAYFFNLLSPIALVMNLWVIPMAFCILLSGVLSLLFFPLSGTLSEIFNFAAAALAGGLSEGIRWAAGIPGGHWFIRSPPLLLVAAWYGVLFAVAICGRRCKWGMVLAGGLLLAGGMAWMQVDAARCRVSVLDVGQSNAVLVQAARERILIDTGGAYRGPRMLRELRRQGVNRLDGLILTHTDAAHIGAAEWLMDQVPVRAIWLPIHTWPSPRLQAVLDKAMERGIPIRRLQAGEEGEWADGLYWEVLWPPSGLRFTRSDEASLILRVARYSASVILMADAGEGEEQQLLHRRPQVLASSLLLAGRHGDQLATTDPWLDAIRPQDVLISAGPHAEGRHPSPELLERLFRRGIRIWRTDQQGNLHIEFSPSIVRWPAAGYRIYPSGP
jgi:competence protein ComEC